MAIASGARGAAGVDHSIRLREAFGVWAKVALNSFGGPAGQIAVMHRFLVDERRWISEQRFLHALNFCMLLPGPEAQQLAVYIGWLMHGTVGGLMAGILFVLPGAVAILALSIVYALYGGVGIVSGLLFGLQAAVVAVVIEAVLRIGRRALKTQAHVMLAAAAFLSIFFLELPFPVVVVAAAVIGFVGGHIKQEQFRAATHGASAPAGEVEALIDDSGDPITRASGRSALRAAGVMLVLWLLPVAALSAFAAGTVFAQESQFFSQTAVVTFGGAYAVLAYIAQQAVGTYGWLRPGEMLTGLGMAETTPGPLIMVVQFVGFLAAYRNPGPFSPLTAGLLGSAVTTWVTFAPCFFFIFAGAPFVERLRGNRSLSAALSAITAAVVGVVLNLAVWFAIHTIFENVAELRRFGIRVLVPQFASVDWLALGITVLAMVAILRLKVSVMKTLALCAALGLVAALFVGV